MRGRIPTVPRVHRTRIPRDEEYRKSKEGRLIMITFITLKNYFYYVKKVMSLIT